jgi:dUTP pyrophosphatase
MSEQREQLQVLVQQLDPELPIPVYAHPGDAGADLVSAVDVELGPGERAVVPTGVALALPEGYAGFVHPRSGLAARSGLALVNAPGTIDAGYRGQVQVVLLNTDRSEAIRLRRGDRIAQLIVQRVERPVFRAVEALPGSVRGDGGFGSTGGFVAGHGAGTASTEATTDDEGRSGVPA